MTKKTTSSSKVAHPWSSEALLAKALRYAQEMQTLSREDWRFGLTSAFVLEFLARSALAETSPALLADAKDWNNIYFALGKQPKAQKFIPKSVDASSVLARLREVIPAFTTELEGFVAQHISRRNEELHAGSIPFEGLPTTWLAPFYKTCQVLLASMSRDLEYLFGAEEAELAKKLIAAGQDESAKAVQKAIAAHKMIWETKEASDQKKLIQKATVWPTRYHGHRVICPACGSEALVIGTAAAAPIKSLRDDLIIEVQDHLPTKFECVACNLKIAGLSQLTACGLGAIYKSTSTYDAADYYAPEDQHENFEDDNNEY
jgi:transcription elongation factor Elf1